MGTLSSDTFTRANNGSNWGTASGGDVWATNVGTPTLSIVSNKGHCTGQTAQAMMQLGTTTSANQEGLVRVVTNNTSSTRMGIALRATASNTFYHGRLSSNANNINIGKVVSGTNTDLFTTAFTVTAGTAYWIRFRVSGSNLYLKAWADGGSEPGWTVTGTDSSITGAGGFGLTTNASSSTTTWDFDSFTVTDGVAPYDVQGRFRLSAVTLKDISARFRQQATSVRDISARFVLSTGQRLRDISGRVRLQSTRILDLSSRFRLFITRVRDTQGRLRLVAGRSLDLACRFNLFTPPIVLPTLAVTAYRGIPVCLPIAVPTGVYTLAGVTLDTPLLCTGPPTWGGDLPAGSAFTLLFQSPSTTTQNALTVGSTGSMLFYLADGSSITAPVVVSGSSLSGTLLQATFMIQTTTSMYSYVTVTQFF